MDVTSIERELRIIEGCLESEEFEMAQEHLIELMQDFYDLPVSDASVQMLERALALPYWEQADYEAGQMELLSHLVEHLGHLRYYTQARDLARQLINKLESARNKGMDKEFLAMCTVTACFWIALAYQREDDFQSAADWFRKLLGIEVVAAEKAMNYEMRLVSMLNLGVCYQNLNDSERAARYLNLLLRYKDVYANPKRPTYDETVTSLINRAENILKNLPPTPSA